MSKYFKITLIALLFAIISWIVAVYGIADGVWIWIASILFSILAICFLTISILKKTITKASPYKIFAISDSIIGVLTFLYAIYDIKTSTGLFAGLCGIILLVSVVPVTIALLLIELLVWVYNKKRENKNGKK